VPSFHSLQEDLAEHVQFLGVYIQEAHAQDEWPISSSRANGDRGKVCIEQPKSTQERCAVARQFQQDFSFSIPMVVDTVANEFDAAFAPWPLRFYVFSGGKVKYIAMPEDGRFDIAKLRDALLQVVA